MIRPNWEFILKILRFILWNTLLLTIGYYIFILQRGYPLPDIEYKNILNTIVSTIGITSAIIISFIFAKLYSDKAEKIARKQKIDKLSIKLTALRKIVHFLKGSHEFWKFNENIKKFLDYKYDYLTLYEYDHKDYKWLQSFQEETGFGELVTQGYLGLKEIEGNVQSSYVFYDRLLRKNYSLRELAVIKDSCQRVWAFMDEYNKNFPDVNTIYEKDTIKENLKLIYPTFIPENLNNGTIQTLFNDFSEGFVREQYQLTQQNKSFDKIFNFLLLDLILFVIQILLGVILLSIKLNDYCKMYLTNIIVSGFIISVIDLIFNVIRSIRKESIVTEFYDV